MLDLGKAVAGRFCWNDPAATKAYGAKAFHGALFGWASCERLWPGDPGRPEENVHG
jgi:hypothetical protein